jgi:hypothetical protein
MVRIRSLCWIGLSVLAIGCTEKSGPTDPPSSDPPLYGAFVVPKISEAADPLLDHAYQAIGAEGNRIAHLSISWAETERGANIWNWTTFDRHVEQARRKGLRLSVVVEFVHGGEGEAPGWRWPVFPDWDDPNLRTGLALFLRELSTRADGTIGYLWLGEGPDRAAAQSPGNDAQILAFYAAIADSARAAFPNAWIGTVVSPRLLAADDKESLVRDLLPSLDLIGLSVATEASNGALPAPQVAVESMAQAVAAWEGGRLAVLDAGYPSGTALGSSEALQAEFATRAGEWLHDRPENLELFCLGAISDPSAELAGSLARRRFPNDADEREADSVRWISAALLRLDGTPKIGRQAWIEARP